MESDNRFAYLEIDLDEPVVGQNATVTSLNAPVATEVAAVEGKCPHEIDNSPVMRKDASFFRKLANEYAIGVVGKLDAMALELTQGVSGTVIDNRLETLAGMAQNVERWAKIMHTDPAPLLTRIDGLKTQFLSADSREATERRSALLEV